MYVLGGILQLKVELLMIQSLYGLWLLYSVHLCIKRLHQLSLQWREFYPLVPSKGE